VEPVRRDSPSPLELDQELEALRRFPDGNPNPVLQIVPGGALLYANPAAAPILEALGVEVGDPLPETLSAELREVLTLEPPRPVELQAGERTYSLLPVDAPELGVCNLYATDVTAEKVLERFPDWNPNPVLRVSREGSVLYANAASLPIMEALGVAAGERLAQDALDRLLECVASPELRPFEVQSRGRHYALHPRFVPELGTINVYGTDITALRAIDKFPDENPNPVLRVTREGRVQYANPASEPLLRALAVEVGGSLPGDFFRRVAGVVARSSEERLELRADGRVFELRAVSVYEFDSINLYGTDVTAARLVEQANRENERLLLAILPPSIAERLRAGERTIADDFEDMSVLFADLVGFTELSSRLPADEIVRILNKVFSTFDALAESHGLEKIKTIGDAYMAVGGLALEPDGSDHAEAVADTALAMVDAVERLAAASGYDLRVRIGIHVGPTVAGVIGMQKFIYDVWGDAVNRASRMESHGVPGRVQVTEETRRRLEGAFTFEPRGEIEVKGLGAVSTSFLVARRAPA
jgi:class 3 adenylate cyclase/PAS domain-containing protein